MLALGALESSSGPSSSDDDSEGEEQSSKVKSGDEDDEEEEDEDAGNNKKRVKPLVLRETAWVCLRPQVKPSAQQPRDRLFDKRQAWFSNVSFLSGETKEGAVKGDPNLITKADANGRLPIEGKERCATKRKRRGSRRQDNGAAREQMAH